ncbi:hypothetical protein R1sor_005310 [Riccia sorocarpa]|uniref:DUF4246 domain-containing protein n=1 Tax=Riccia sorocarpa TaxID=122646 RepID=A0ABD3HMU7_9MARC
MADALKEREELMASESGSKEGLKQGIRSKPQWEEKVFDESISKKYKLEAQEQEISPDLVDIALEQLRQEASYILHGRSDSAAGNSGGSSSSSTLEALETHSVNFDELKKSVSSAHDKIQAGEGLVESLEEKGNGVWVVDGMVPQQLRDVLETRLDAIANSPNKDFHPNTNDQVQDLIHPSLFPYIEGVSPLLVDPSLLPEKPATSYWNRHYEDSTYQWLPAEFFVDEKGSVKIESYINNLDEKQHGDLYRGIELLFQIFVPLFEKLKIEPGQLNGNLSRRLNLHNRKLQVIVKAANYVIQPKGQVYEGTWHMEGMSHERIVASGIYYYSTSSCLNDSGLEFRRERDEKIDYPQYDHYAGCWTMSEEPEDDSDGCPVFPDFDGLTMNIELGTVSMSDETGNDIPDVDGLTMNIQLGTVPTVGDRLIVFPNSLQHKVSGIANTSEDQVGTRKILVFFLVDPDNEIISTRHVPPQQWERFVPQLVILMSLIVKRVAGTFFPLPLIQEIVSRAKSGLTLAEARRHRLELMRERKYKIEHDNEEWEREAGCCNVEFVRRGDFEC